LVTSVKLKIATTGYIKPKNLVRLHEKRGFRSGCRLHNEKKVKRV
jgi:hypothetical protein